MVEPDRPVFFRLGLARCSAAHWCGLRGIQASLSSPGRSCSHPLFWLSTRNQHCPKVPLQWSATQRQSEKKTWVCEGQRGRAQTLPAGGPVRGPALGSFWDTPIGGNWQKFREEGWWLVWPFYSGTYTTVRASEESVFISDALLFLHIQLKLEILNQKLIETAELFISFILNISTIKPHPKKFMLWFPAALGMFGWKRGSPPSQITSPSSWRTGMASWGRPIV